MRSIAIIVGMLSCLLGSAWGQCSLERVGVFGGRLGSRGAVVDHTLFVGATAFSSHVYDISDLGHPVLLNDFALESGSFLASGDVLFRSGDLLDGTPGLQVFDASNAPSLTLIGELAIGDLPPALVGVQGTTLYAYQRSAFWIIDTSDPTQPRAMGRYHARTTISGARVVGDVAYLALQKRGVAAIDISDPRNMVELDRRDFGHPEPQALCIEVIGDVAYVSAGFGFGEDYDGVWLFDVSDPTDITVLPNRLEWLDDAYEVRALGDVAYVANGDSGIRVLDVSDPRSPVQLDGLRLLGPATSILLHEHVLYVTGPNLAIIDVSVPRSPVLLHEIIIPNHASDLAIHNGIGVLADEAGNQVKVLDLANPEAPRVLGVLSGLSGTEAGLVELDWPTAFVSSRLGQAGIDAIDVSDPTRPRTIGRLPSLPGGSVQDMARVGSLLFTAEGMTGIGVIDVSNLSAPQYAGTLGLRAFAQAIALVGDVAYVGTTDTRQVVSIDASDPGALAKRGAIGGFRPVRSLAATQSLLAVGTDDQLLLYDVSASHTPLLLSALGSGTVRGLSFQGNRLVVVAGPELAVLDVTNPLSPIMLASTPISGVPRRVTMDGTTAYVMNDSFTGPVTIIDILDCAGVCAPDISGDWRLNTDDFFQFLALYQAMDPRADFEPDGTINADDFLAYLDAYGTGC